MIVLALDTTVPPGSLALWRDGMTTEVVLDEAASPSVQLPARIDTLLAGAGLVPGAVDVFAVAIGPGSLTGLRVGIATIQGLAFATARPVVAVSTLEALAVSAALTPRPPRHESVVVAWTHAHRGEVFAQIYLASASGGTLHDPLDFVSLGLRLAPVEEPTVGAPGVQLDEWTGMLDRDAVTFVGNAVPLTADLLAQRLPAARRLPGVPLAAVLASIAVDRAARGLAISPHAIRPLYVRKPDAVVARERAAAARLARNDTSSPSRD